MSNKKNKKYVISCVYKKQNLQLARHVSHRDDTKNYMKNFGWEASWKTATSEHNCNSSNMNLREIG
jgi:hypothetical protein